MNGESSSQCGEVSSDEDQNEENDGNDGDTQSKGEDKDWEENNKTTFPYYFES